MIFWAHNSATKGYAVNVQRVAPNRWEVREGRRCWMVFGGTKLSPEPLNGAIIFNERNQSIDPSGQLGKKLVKAVERSIYPTRVRH